MSLATTWRSQPAPIRWLCGVMFAFMFLEFIVQSLAFYQYSLANEAPYLHYIGWLVAQKGLIPYRDIFETSFPGTFLFHAAIISVVGYGDYAFRTVDIVFSLLLMTVTWHIMRVFHARVAWAAALSFALVYLYEGAAMTLVRDYVAILPIALALLCAVRQPWQKRELNALLIGACMALAMLIKPQFGVGLPVMLWLLLADHRSAQPGAVRDIVGVIVLSGIGAIAVFSWPLLWLYKNGGLWPFLDMLTRYMPLYLSLDGASAVMDAHSYWKGVGMPLAFHSLAWLIVVPAAWRGWVMCNAIPAQKRLVLALLTLALMYLLITVPGHKFWAYHFMPFNYFCCLVSALLLLPTGKNSHSARLISYTAGAVFFGWHQLTYGAIIGDMLIVLKNPHAAVQQQPGIALDYKMANILREHLQPGDVVQPLDTMGMSTRIMLLANALPASAYLESFPLYHHVSHPFITGVRAAVLAALQQPHTRFIIYSANKSVHFTGADTDNAFSALDSYTAEHFHEIYNENDVHILERNNSATFHQEQIP